VALSKDDLNKIGKLIKTGNEYLDAKWDKRFTQLELKLVDHDHHFDVIEKKLDQIIKTENEDIMAIFNDLQGVKTRLKKANI
jgi:hypothetical protein